MEDPRTDDKTNDKIKHSRGCDENRGAKNCSAKGRETDGGESQEEGRNYTYMLRCADGSLYTGWTNDLERRLKAHQSGKGGKYTRTHRPVKLVYQENFPDRRDAMRREWQIKQLSKAEKEQLVEAYQRDGREGYRESIG